LTRAIAAYRVDAAIAILLFVLGTAAALWASSSVDPSITDMNKFNIWADADSPRVFANMTSRFSDHWRARVHPLFSLAAFTPTAILIASFDLSPLDAVRLVDGIAAGIWIALLFIAMRIAGLLRLDAGLFTILGGVSAAAVFFATIPETYVFGSLTILTMVIVVAISEHRPVSAIAYCVAVATTLSMTTSNVMVGIFAAFREMHWKKAIPLLLCALAIVTLVWGIQKAIFPSAPFFLGVRGETAYVTVPGIERFGEVFSAFFLHSMIVPRFALIANDFVPEYRDLSVQAVSAFSGGTVYLVGLLAWVALLGIGVYSLVRARSKRKLVFVLACTVVGQFALHLVYGRETVLFSLHYLPVLIILIGVGCSMFLRTLSRVLVCVLIVCAVIANLSEFSQARGVLAEQGTQRQLVRAQMRLRPKDPWPRGTGHTVVAFPGSAEVDKSYVEPGGSFSPRVGSFGIGVWLVGPDGSIVRTSDSIELAKTKQRFTNFPEMSEPPGVVSSTPYYALRWSLDSDSEWQGTLTWQPAAQASPVLAIRSVGPAGGPIYSLRRRGEAILVNERWLVEFSPAPASVRLGWEGRERLSATMGSASVEAPDNSTGWGIAVVRAPDAGQFIIHVKDLSPIDESSNAASAGILESVLGEPRSIDVNVPDARFVDSFHAQEAQLLMGLVDAQTRPADPISYPLAWQRDGAYIVDALARVGREAAARRLTKQLQNVDFFGGFGAEADAPGLGLWALSEVANLARGGRRLDDLREQWPDIVRKAAIIEEMLAARAEIRKDFAGPLLPSVVKQPWDVVSLIAERAQDGLIQGKMDFERPVFYVNSVSYLGLVRAARIAVALGETRYADRWNSAAESIRSAWIKKFGEGGYVVSATSFDRNREFVKRQIKWTVDDDFSNDRTWISPLWPSTIGAAAGEQVARGLRARWEARRAPDGGFKNRPLWTYHDIAEAHQWLELGDRAKVWATLEWFWKNQPSPGLYQWWEGSSEENSFAGWDQVRGWVAPPYTLPHYGSAAEMLLLQLDMLVSWRQEPSGYALTIGRGVPDAWIGHPMSISNVPIPGGRLSWRWDGAELSIDIDSDKTFRLNLGPAFPSTTKLRVVGNPRVAQ
jgi:hypothetical protein